MAVLSLIAGGNVPAHADLIGFDGLPSQEKSIPSLDGARTSFDLSFVTASPLYGTELQVWNVSDTTGSSCGRSSSPPSSPLEPTDPSVPSESPFVGLGIPSSSSGAGSDSGSSGRGFGSSAANAVIGWLTEFPQPTLIGWLKVVGFLDIPPAPPFELLRPPQILTNIA